MHYVYILQSEKDHGLYIGKTNNIDRRISEHQGGFVQSTKSRRPLKLMDVMRCSDELKARNLEKELKKGHNREKLKQKYCIQKIRRGG